MVGSFPNGWLADPTSRINVSKWLRSGLSSAYDLEAGPDLTRARTAVSSIDIKLIGVNDALFSLRFTSIQQSV